MNSILAEAAALKMDVLVPPSESSSVPLRTLTVPLLLKGTWEFVVPVVPCLLIVPDAELAQLGTLFPDRYFGELIFLAREGVLIVPSDMGARPIRGMHGYHPTDIHSYAALCTNQEVLPDDITSIPDIFRLMTRDADLAKARNSIQSSNCLPLPASV